MAQPSAGQVLLRGLTLRCPACGGRTLFRGLLGMAERCRRCGLVFERDDGFYLGATVVNYLITALLIYLPLLVLVFRQQVETRTALAIGVAGGIVLPLLLYRPAKSIWLASYFLIFPRELRVLDPRAERTQPR